LRTIAMRVNLAGEIDETKANKMNIFINFIS